MYRAETATSFCYPLDLIVAYVAPKPRANLVLPADTDEFGLTTSFFGVSMSGEQYKQYVAARWSYIVYVIDSIPLLYFGSDA